MGESPALSMAEIELNQVAQDVLDEILNDMDESEDKLSFKIGENRAPIRIGSYSLNEGKL